MFYPLIAERETEVVNKDLEDQYKHGYKHKIFYPLIGETETEVVHKDLEDQYKHSYKHKMFYPLIAETEVVNKDLEDQYKCSYKIKMSQLMRLWYLSHRRPAKAQASLHICTVSPEPSLFTKVWK